MIHSVPVIDFVGVLQVNSLELGSIEVNLQPVPAVRFVLKQNKSYSILASGHLAGEVYAYCVAALEKGIEEIDVKIACVLPLDTGGNLHATATSVTWYTSKNLRRQASGKVLHIFEQRAKDEFKTCAIPFIAIESKQ